MAARRFVILSTAAAMREKTGRTLPFTAERDNLANVAAHLLHTSSKAAEVRITVVGVNDKGGIRLYRIGLTGGIASGKSTVTAMLRTLGAAVIDCDGLARHVVRPSSPGLAAVAAAFGPQTLLPDGTMDRQYIGACVFGDDGAKKKLEQILFPLIMEEIDEHITAWENNAKYPFIFLDMPLLFEIKYNTYVDEVWLVYVDPQTQLCRLMERNGYTEAEALSRMRAQLPITEKRALAQVIIDNTGAVDATREQVRHCWNRLMSNFGLQGDSIETQSIP